MPESALAWDFAIEGGNFKQAGHISSTVKRRLKELGFDPPFIRRVAIASYEAEMNVVCHAYRGTFYFAINSGKVTIVVKDRGPGIEDIDLAMREGYSTASAEVREMGFGAGMGLSNMKRNADSLRIDSVVGQGTAVEMTITLPASPEKSE